MQNKKLIVSLVILVLLVGAAAFVGGRLLNQQAGPLGLDMLLGGGSGEVMSVSVQLTPAPELPTTEPAALGLFAERKDKTLVLQSISMEAGRGGVVVQSSSGGDGESLSVSPLDSESGGPKVEVVVTNETIIYLETTQPPDPSAMEENQVIQQTVAEGSLDDLTSQSFVTVWGRKSGDRIIAEIVFISNPVMIQRP